MRMLYWCVFEVLSGIGIGMLGYFIPISHLFELGVAGTMLPLFHNLIGSTLWYEHKLRKENKYAVDVLCHNCQTYNTFRILNGKTVQETIVGRKCGYCNNEFKIQFPNEVKHE